MVFGEYFVFFQLQSILQQRSQKRSSHMLKMKEISSMLGSLENAVIPLPGNQQLSDI